MRERLATAEGADAWIYAEALAHYGDPFLLGKRIDPLWIFGVLEDKPRMLSSMVQTWLEKRRAKVIDESKLEDFLRQRRDN